MKNSNILIGLLLLIGLASISGVYGSPSYNDITVVNLEGDSIPKEIINVDLLIYNNSNGEVMANTPVTVFYDDNTHNTTTDSNGVLNLTVNLTDGYEYIEFISVNGVNTPGLSIWISGEGNEYNYWSSIKYDNYFIANNGTINISIPISEGSGIKPASDGHINLSVNGIEKTFEIKNGLLNVYLENITEITTVQSYDGGLRFYIYPNNSNVIETEIIPQYYSEVYFNDIVSYAVVCHDGNNKPIANQSYTVKITYDGMYPEKDINIKTNDYGIATFNITANASNYISIRVINETINVVDCYADIHIINNYNNEETSPELNIYSTGADIINTPINYKVTFKNGTTPIANSEVKIYSYNGYITTVTTDSSGEASFTITYPNYGDYIIYAITKYNNKKYDTEHYEDIIPIITQNIQLNNNKLIINAENGIYKVVKNPIHWDEGLVLDSGFNATNKEVVINASSYGEYKLVNYYGQWSSRANSAYYLPFKVTYDNLYTVTKYTKQPYNIIVKDNSGNPIPNAMVICDIDLNGKSYKEYALTAYTDSTGKATIYINTKDYDRGSVKIYVSDKNYIFPVVGEEYFDIEGLPANIVDLTGAINYNVINNTTYEIVLEVKNNGNIDAQDFDTELYVNGNLVEQDRSPLSSGSIKYIKYNYSINSTDDIIITSYIDSKNEINEVDELNNKPQKTISFPDLIVGYTNIPGNVKVNKTYNLRLSLLKQGLTENEVLSNLTVKLNDNILCSKIITFNKWNWDYKYETIPMNITNYGKYNLTITLTPINSLDKNLLNNNKTIELNAIEPKATIRYVYGLPYNNITDANGNYKLNVGYNVSVPGYYITKIATTDKITINGHNSSEKYVWKYGYARFNIMPNKVSNNENITISIYDKDTNKKLAEKIIHIKITDHPVVIKYGNSTITNTTTTLNFEIFNTTEYDSERLVNYFAYVPQQGRVLDGIESLSRYPHGCIEQTTSPMVASIYVKKYVNSYNISSTVNYDSKIYTGIKRLTTGAMAPKDLGNEVYAWGLWGNTNPRIIYTAYVIYGLTTAKLEGNTVNQTYIDNGIKYIINSQNADGSWNKNYSSYDYRVDNLMNTEPACNSLVTLALTQTYATTTNNTLKTELFNATNKSVRYLISQDTTGFDSYDYGFMLWALSEAYNMGINDTNVSNEINWLIGKLDTNTMNSGSSSYSWYGTKTTNLAISSIGLQKAKKEGFNNTDKYEIINNNITSLYNPNSWSGWGSTKSTGLALRALTETYVVNNSGDTTITIKIDNNIIVNNAVINSSNPKITGKYINDSILTSGTHNYTVEISGNNNNMLIGLVTEQTTPYSIAIKSNGKEHIDPLATDFNLSITNTKAIENREFNMTFNIINYNDTYPISVGILDITLPEGLTNATNLSELKHASMIKYNSTDNTTKIYIYPELINKSSTLSITIPVKVCGDSVSKTVNAVFYPMYNEETIAPASKIVEINPLRKININLPNGWSESITLTEDKTIITIN